MLLSVVVVNWNSQQDLMVCLESLARQTHDDIEVIVVDNGSSDGSVLAVRERYPSHRVIVERENLGFAEGANFGIAASRGEWVAVLNNDTVADPGWAAGLVAAAQAAPPTCGMLQSVLLFMDRPSEINSTGIVLTPWGSGNDRCEGERLEQLREEEIFCPTAGACAYRRRMLEQIKLPVGYFDRDHFMYFEDLDLGWRARLAGWTAQLVPDSIVHHKYQASAARHGRAWMIVLSHRNRLRTLIKNASPGFLARTMPRTLEEVARLFRIEGVAMLLPLARAVFESTKQRRVVSNMVRASREDVEETWVGRGARPLVRPRREATANGEPAPGVT
jgi:GT2 family glycosyltransferase